jgi:cytochrome P450
MRYCPIIFGTIRRAADDGELGGVRIPVDTLVLANTAAANRDPDVYTDPDCLDITRDDPSAMLTFGGGVHYCLGAHLARLELTEALRVVTRRMPNPAASGRLPGRRSRASPGRPPSRSSSTPATETWRVSTRLADPPSVHHRC